MFFLCLSIHLNMSCKRLFQKSAIDIVEILVFSVWGPPKSTLWHKLSNNLLQVYSGWFDDMIPRASDDVAFIIKIVKDLFIYTNSIAVSGNAFLVGYIRAKLSTDFLDQFVKKFHQKIQSNIMSWP